MSVRLATCDLLDQYIVAAHFREFYHRRSSLLFTQGCVSFVGILKSELATFCIPHDKDLGVSLRIHATFYLFKRGLLFDCRLGLRLLIDGDLVGFSCLFGLTAEFICDGCCRR